MSYRDVVYSHKDFVGEEFIKRLSIVRKSIVKEEIVIQGDGVIIYGDLFGENIRVDLDGYLIINGNIGVINEFTVKSSGGLLVVNGTIYPASKVKLVDSIVLGSVLGKDVVVEKSVFAGFLSAISKDGDTGTSLKASNSCAFTYTSLEKLVLDNIITILPILYGGRSIELHNDIYVSSPETVLLLRNCILSLRECIRKIKGIGNALESIQFFTRNVNRLCRNVDKIIEFFKSKALAVIKAKDVSVPKGILPLHVLFFSKEQRSRVNEVYDIVEKIIVDKVLKESLMARFI